ncbi:MAG: GAF domain-containing protein [Anaerolineales bacterium]|nr:GAF domain-containing protein [Anaerolineales bacterium]
MTTGPLIRIDTNQTLDTMLHQVLNQALVAIGAEAGSLMLVANRRGILQIKARLGKPRPGRKTEPIYRTNAGSIAAWAVNNKQSYLCPDVELDPYFERPRDGNSNFRSLLSVPVIHAGKVLAVINADAEIANFFTETHRLELERVARHVALPLAERISILDALAEVGVELSRLPGEGGVSPVLNKIAQLAVKSLGADVVTLYMYSQERGEFSVPETPLTIAGQLRDPRPMQRKVYPGDVPWIVVKERRPGFYPTVQTMDFLTREVERPNEPPRRRFIEREGIQSMAALLLPFRAAEMPKEEVVGAMFVNYRTQHDFNIDEVSAMATFADYAAVAILNARREEQRRDEQIRMEEQRRIEQIKMAETISANFAHRMGNLAGASRLAVQVLKHKLAGADDVIIRQLDLVERKSDVLFELAERLVRPIRKTGSVFELGPVDIRRLIESELAPLARVAPQVAIVSEVPESLPRAWSVDFQIREVFHDVLNNAIEAMQGLADARLTVRACLNAKTHKVEVEISDSGPGIAPEIVEKLFSLGTTTKGSLGIGLWWGQTFMRATGGDLTLKHTFPGGGATFAIEVPCLEATDPAGGASPGRTEADVLLVDDDPDWLLTLGDTLQTGAYVVHTAQSYEQALTALANTHYRLAVLDLRLKDPDTNNRDGLRLLAHLDAAHDDTRVIMVTGYAMDGDEPTARQSSRLVDYMRKQTFDPIRFIEHVQRIVGK